MTTKQARAGGKGWVAEVERACASQGLQLTAARRSVLAILGHSRAPLGAYAILDALARQEGKPVAPPTVYRALDFFLDHGFLHKIESRNAYAPCEHVGHDHQGVLLLCEKCGRARRFRAPSPDGRDAGSLPGLRQGGVAPFRRRRGCASTAVRLGSPAPDRRPLRQYEC